MTFEEWREKFTAKCEEVKKAGKELRALLEEVAEAGDEFDKDLAAGFAVVKTVDVANSLEEAFGVEDN